MAKTINRIPVQVRVNTIKDYFFNHTNWKGLCTSKNILTVDQETFAQCDNVYVNTNKILSSRPSIIKYNQYGITNIVNEWSFDDILVLQYIENYQNKLAFIRYNEIQCEMNCSVYVKLILVESKIFIFGDSNFGYFDVKTALYGNMYYVDNVKVVENDDPERYIYIPNTVISSNYIQTKDEYANELTLGNTKTLLYANNLQLNFSDLLNKELTLKISGEYYTISNFVENNEKVILQSLSVVPGIVKTSIETNTFISYDSVRNIIYHSIDGKLWEPLPTIRDIVGEPFITNNGASCIVFKVDGFYMFSLLKSVNNVYDFVDIYGNRIWQKFEYGLQAGEYLDITTIPCALFDTNDIYAFVIKSNLDIPYFLLSNPDTALPTATAMPYSVNSLGTIVELGKIDFTQFAGIATKLAFTYILNDDTFNIAVYSISNTGAVTFIGTSLLDYDGMMLTGLSVDIPLKDTDLRISWDQSSIDYNLFIAGRVGTTFPVADCYWNVLVESELVPTNVKATPIVEDLPFVNPSTKFVISRRDLSILTDRYLFINNAIIPLLPYNLNSLPIVNDVYLMNYSGQLFTSNFSDVISITFINTPSQINFKKFYNFVELDNLYLSCEDKLYISEERRNEYNEFLWYLPTVNTQQFNYDITGLHVLSKEDIGIFFQNEIWYVTSSVLNDIQVYRYTKSKLQTGILQGSTVLTSYDGKYTMFCTSKGLVAMAYQDFIASTEQALTYLSDNISTEWVELSKQPILMFYYEDWLICYQTKDQAVLLYDLRNGSWWPWTMDAYVSKVVLYNNNIVILAKNELYTLTSGSDKSIRWFIKSQPLHLSAINNYKHIDSITFNSVSEYNDSFTCILSITNYRDTVNEDFTEALDYDIDVYKTFVKRLNFSKVNQFQYILQSDNSNSKPIPLSLTSIVVKYGIKERVR